MCCRDDLQLIESSIGVTAIHGVPPAATRYSCAAPGRNVGVASGEAKAAPANRHMRVLFCVES